MNLYIITAILICIIAVILCASYKTYLMGFYWKPKQKQSPYGTPRDEQYAPYDATMKAWIDRILAVPYEKVSIQSFDGLRLVGKYYHTADGAPCEILMHGYHGVAERDFSGGHHLALSMGHNVLLIDERAHGESEGHTVTFGINERRDCLSWITYINERFGADTKIILCGVSMGAATVLMAAGLPLPANVKGIVADCGYSSPKEIILKVIGEMHLPFPVPLSYLCAHFGSFVYGHFRLESASAVEAMRQCKIPVLIIHGEADHFVPVMMGQKIYDACAAEDKTIFTVPGAPHAISMVVDPEGYSAQVRNFAERVLR